MVCALTLHFFASKFTRTHLIATQVVTLCGGRPGGRFLDIGAADRLVPASCDDVSWFWLFAYIDGFLWLGDLWRCRGWAKKAGQYYECALRMCEQASGKCPGGEGARASVFAQVMQRVMLAKLTLLAAQGKWEDARDLLAELGTNSATEGGGIAHDVNVLVARGDFARRSPDGSGGGDLVAALALYNRAQELIDSDISDASTQRTRIRSDVLWRTARVLSLQGSHDEARCMYEQVLAANAPSSTVSDGQLRVTKTSTCKHLTSRTPVATFSWRGSCPCTGSAASRSMGAGCMTSS